jgi:F-type H+-transporting ATPase subunit gamma
VLEEREEVKTVGILLVTGDRGLAGAFNSQILRAGVRRGRELEREGKQVVFYGAGRRGVSSLRFRGMEVGGAYEGFTDRPAYSDARDIAGDVTSAYVDGKLDRVEVVYNGYVSALTQEVKHETLLPLQQIDELVSDEEREEGAEEHRRSLWIYEPEPEEILRRLVPDYVEISIFRALLESTASEHGARMTAMRNASENAAELIDDLTLAANRQRQAEITQEIMEVVAGAEGLR